ncbi:probable RNA polymerase II C-terminal domain phosphatase-like 1 at N-terminal half [Coccomyxa sp. Obi]|nr:probable RNA polymerase II C-terminal domain phosphatase-like 1 at N-terminal half [Coccomyxa sp. Obi]
MSAFQLVLGDNEPIQCDWQPQPGWSQTLTSKLPPQVAVRDYWTCKRQLLVLHVLTGGPCLALFPSSQTSASGRKALEDQHAQCLADGTAGMGSVDDTVDLLLVAQTALDGVSPSPLFLGYLVARGAAEMATALIDNSRLPLLFDLDETLLSAFTANNLRVRIKNLRERLAVLKQQKDDSAQEEVCQIEREIVFKQEDNALLDQFMSNDTVTVGDKTYSASVEEAKPEAGMRPVPRPVIRLDNGVVLTRIDPDRKETSMLFRTRPGWHKLRLWLEGQDGDSHRPGRQRFEVYVCTAAERSYALEAWRHLDPSALLIPMAQRQQRFVCVPSGRLKDIADVIGLPGHPWLPGPNTPNCPNSAMPLAIILDDRVDVWHDLSRGQIFQVKAFHPHQHAALKDGVAMHDEKHVRMLSEEMSAVKEALCNTRAWMYYCMTNELEPILAETKPLNISDLRAGMPFLKPKCPRISNLIKKAREGNLEAPAPAAANHFPAKIGATGLSASVVAALAPEPLRQVFFPGVQPAVAAAPAAAAAPAPVGPADQQRPVHAAPNAPQNQRVGAQQQQTAATASAAEPDQARQASNVAAGPSGAAPKGAARLRGAVNPRDMAMAPGAPGGAPAKVKAPGAGRGLPPQGKPQGRARGGPLAALGRPNTLGGGPGKNMPDKHAAAPPPRPVQGRARPPAVPRLPHLPGHQVQGRQAVPAAAAAAVGRGTQQQIVATGSSIGQLARKRSLNGNNDAPPDRAKQPAMPAAANGKRRAELSASQQKAWLDFAKPSSSSAAAPNTAGTGATGSDNGGSAAQGSSAAADNAVNAERPEQQALSAQANGTQLGPDEVAPGQKAARPPSACSQEQSSQGTSKLGLGGSFLPARSPRTTRGSTLLAPSAVPSVSSPPKKRARTAEEDALDSDRHASAQAHSPKGAVGPDSPSTRMTADLVIPSNSTSANLDELPAELHRKAGATGAKLEFLLWEKKGYQCAGLRVDGKVIAWSPDNDVESAKKKAIQGACEKMGVPTTGLLAAVRRKAGNGGSA